MRGRHVKVEGTAIRFRFKGKGGAPHEVDLRDRRLATVIRRCQDLPGQELFQYQDDGTVGDVTSDDVNGYLREISKGDFTAKDFRTWAGTVLAYRSLSELPEPPDERTKKRNVVEAVRRTAAALRNTPAVSRQAYIHPAVLEAYVDGAIDAAEIEDLTSAEQAVVGLLRERLDADVARTTRRASRSQGRR